MIPVSDVKKKTPEISHHCLNQTLWVMIPSIQSSDNEIVNMKSGTIFQFQFYRH